MKSLFLLLIIVPMIIGCIIPDDGIAIIGYKYDNGYKTVSGCIDECDNCNDCFDKMGNIWEKCDVGFIGLLPFCSKASSVEDYQDIKCKNITSSNPFSNGSISFGFNVNNGQRHAFPPAELCTTPDECMKLYSVIYSYKNVSQIMLYPLDKE